MSARRALIIVGNADLSGQQAAAFAFITDYLSSHHISPTFEEIACDLGVGRTRARLIVSELIERGVIARAEGAR